MNINEMFNWIPFLNQESFEKKNYLLTLFLLSSVYQIESNELKANLTVMRNISEFVLIYFNITSAFHKKIKLNSTDKNNNNHITMKKSLFGESP